jgi:hypothetical protein
MRSTEMPLARYRRSKEVIIGAVATGVAALGVAVAMPANAKTFNTTISATGPDESTANANAQQKCIDEAGTTDITVKGFTTSRNADGSYTSTATCSYQKKVRVTKTGSGPDASSANAAAQQKCMDEAGTNDITVESFATSQNSDGSYTSTATCII